MKRALYPGFLAFAVGIAVLAIFRQAFGALTPPEVLLDAVPRLVPLGVFSAVIQLLGPWAKVFAAAIIALAAFVASWALAAAWRSAMPGLADGRTWCRWLSAAGLGLGLWLFGMLVVLPLAGKGPFAVSVSPWPAIMLVSWLASALGYASVLAALGEGVTGTPGPAAARGTPPSPERRDLIRKLSWIAGGAVVAAAVGAAVWKSLSRLPSRVLRSLSDSAPVPEVTSNDEFYSVSKNLADPWVDAASWRLQIKGLVERPATYDFSQLQQLPAVTQYLTLECISNDVGGSLIGTAEWKGVRLEEVLSRAGVQPAAMRVVLRAADGYSDSITVDKAMEPGTVLAYEMNGVPLPREHGFPARLLVPDIYGMKNVKWLTGIELVDYEYAGYWQQQGWSNTAVIQTMSRMDVPPGPGEYQLPEKATLSGVAFGGGRGISWVEISADGGETWSRAQLKQPLSHYTWVLWAYDWSPPAEGTYTLLVRAADGQGQVQPEARSGALPDGATGYHRLVVELREE